MTTALRHQTTSLFSRLLDSTLTWFVLGVALYLVAAAGMWNEQSLAPHYIHLADSLLHGRLDLMHTENLYDLLVVGDKAYVAGSPMPAILLIPIIVIFNNQFSDILFSVVIGAANVALVHRLFRKPWLTLLFALGTPHLYVAALGSVWLMAHVVAILFALLALYFGWKRRNYFVAGLFLMLAGLARPTLLFGAAFFALFIWLTTDGRRRWRALALFALPLAAGVALHMGYNDARFGAPLDFGYQHTFGAPNIVATYNAYGGFNPHFLSCNLYVSLLNPPLIGGQAPAVLYRACDHLLAPGALAQTAGAVTPNPIGMSLILVTPAFLLLLGARRRRPDVLAAWAGLLAVMVPLWLYHNTGSLQFGYRYWLDAAPFWLLLLAATYPIAAADGWATRFDRLLERLRLPLIALSIVINLWGFLWIYNVFVGHQWYRSWYEWLAKAVT